MENENAEMKKINAFARSDQYAGISILKIVEKQGIASRRFFELDLDFQLLFDEFVLHFYLNRLHGIDTKGPGAR